MNELAQAAPSPAADGGGTPGRTVPAGLAGRTVSAGHAGTASGEPSKAGADIVLEAVDLRKRYGAIQALDGFCLTVAAGEVVGLVGHNGAGKTTFLEMVASLVRPDSGRITVDGADPLHSRGVVGICPQHIALYPSATVREHLRLFGGINGLRRRALRGEIDRLAAGLRLTEIIDRRVGVLSGGQQRRTQAAVALIHRPRLMLLDEPTAGADPETRQAVLDVVRDRAAEGGSVVYTTHYLPELTELRATIAVARRGRVIARGTGAELLERLPGQVRVRFADDEVQMSTMDTTGTLVTLLHSATAPVTEVEIRKPSLDDLYRSLAVSDDQ
ncbi:ABC transporter ATP-binding protein [Micromonospora sp. WMMD1102]|uniref:ABC transporter ATP-binding protein n=1 Tax=Micromonospora sp. WMMD1102 TaxID=3016105 RepID=UPI0024153239|nr:ABC transporter ATP-binding protein [Micromonospora sp. WMMD1102]MDG4785094.1 ABC transporter ATP-binding protein [Micromonospora sp. WMMD1102]